MKTNYIFCKVLAGASRQELLYDKERQVFKVVVCQPRDGGKANKAVCSYLAELLGIPKYSISIVSGLTTTIKRICIISSYDEEKLHARLLSFVVKN
jgi:uncharacterized protein YggU (UPF0235/DUF167 family)